jgi:hypothetical protein
VTYTQVYIRTCKRTCTRARSYENMSSCTHTPTEDDTISSVTLWMLEWLLTRLFVSACRMTLFFLLVEVQAKEKDKQPAKLSVGTGKPSSPEHGEDDTGKHSAKPDVKKEGDGERTEAEAGGNGNAQGVCVCVCVCMCVCLGE